MKDSPGLHFKTYVLLLFVVYSLRWKCPAEQGDERDWFGPELDTGGPISCPRQDSDFRHHLAWDWLPARVFVAYMLVLTWADYATYNGIGLSHAVVAVLSYFLWEVVRRCVGPALPRSVKAYL
jgi:hypothetical protein